MPVANIYRTSAFGPAIPPRLVSGGFALFANGTGTASFDSFRVTVYPDPSLALTPAGRAATNLTNWNANTPTNTNLAIATSVDNGTAYQPVANPGDPIPLVAQMAFYQAVRSLSGLLGYWRLNERSGVSAYDSSINGNTGTITGGVTLGQAGNLQGMNESSDPSMLFNGSSGYISLPAAVSTNGLTALSIGVWIKLGTYTNNPRVIANSHADFDTGGGFELAIAGPSSGGFPNGGAGTVGLALGTGSTAGLLSSTAQLAVGAWHFVAFTWDGSTIKFYLDGSAQVATTSFSGTIGTAGAVINIGRDPVYSGDYFTGDIQTVFLCSSALSAATISALYSAATTATQAVYDDSFTSDTSGQYTQTNGSGGSVATWTWDTANSRVRAVGGSEAVLLWNTVTASDVALVADFYQSENGGMVWGWKDSSDYYELVVKDSAASSGANSMTLYKALGSVFASDTFVRANQSGWGTSSDGETWSFTGAAATESITSNEGVLKANGNADTHAQIGSVTAGDQEIVCRLAVNDGSNDIVGVEARFSAAAGSTCYKLLYYSNAIHINKSVSGANTNLVNSGAAMLTNNTFYWFRLRCVGTTIEGRVWQDGTTEPGTWLLTTTDSSIASGGFALLANTSSASGISFDHFQVNNPTILSQLTTGAINFPTRTYRRVTMSMLSGVITATFDGAQILTYTDASPLSGQAGLRNDTGTSYFYRLQITPQPADLTGQYLCTRQTLTSTDPTATPQLLDFQALISGPDIGPGVLVQQKDYRRTFVGPNVDELNKDSDYWWYVRSNKSTVFQARTATLAPWILASVNFQTMASQQIGDVLLQNLNLSNSGDLYRSRQIMKDAIATASFSELKFGDGQSRSWNVAYPLSAPPTSIVLNGLAQSIGVKGVDTGRAFYYQLGSTAIDQDSSQTILTSADSFVVTYTGSFSQDVVIDNTSLSGTITQSQYAAITRLSGIVEAVEDASSMTVAQATTTGTQRLQRYGNIGRTLTFSTTRPGLAPGQQLMVFIPELNLVDAQLLITDVTITSNSASVSGGILYFYQITATEGPNLGNWVKLFSSVMGSI